MEGKIPGFIVAEDTCEGCGWSFITSRPWLRVRNPIAQLEESAGLGCPRCGLLVKAVKLFKDRWGAGCHGDETAVRVVCHMQGAGVGIRVLWPENNNANGSQESWKQIGIEIFSKVYYFLLNQHIPMTRRRCDDKRRADLLHSTPEKSGYALVTIQSPKPSSFSRTRLAYVLDG